MTSRSLTRRRTASGPAPHRPRIHGAPNRRAGTVDHGRLLGRGVRRGHPPFAVGTVFSQASPWSTHRPSRRPTPKVASWRDRRSIIGASSPACVRRMFRRARPDLYSPDRTTGVGVTNLSAPVSVTFRTVRRALAASPEAASLARRAIDELATGDHGMSATLLDDLRLLVSEVVTNAVRHAGASAGDEIELIARSGNGRVRVEVTDPGAGFRYDGPSGTLEAEGGWGLYLVDRIADRWGIDDDPSTRVWFELVDRPASVARVDEATLFDAIGAAVVATDPEGTITHWNRGAETLYGYPRNETIGRSLAEFFVEPDDAQAAERILERIRSGEAWGGEWNAPRKDGSRLDIVYSNAPVRDARDRLMGVVGHLDGRRRSPPCRGGAATERGTAPRGARGRRDGHVGMGRRRRDGPMGRGAGADPRARAGLPSAAPSTTTSATCTPTIASACWPRSGTRSRAATTTRCTTGSSGRDGDERWLSARARVLRDRNGAAERLVGVCTDVTERTQRRAAARRRTRDRDRARAGVDAGGDRPRSSRPSAPPSGGTSAPCTSSIRTANACAASPPGCVRVTTPGRFVATTAETAFARGDGLPGRVWERAEPVWIDDFATAPGLPRGTIAARSSLHAAIGFPIRWATPSSA